MQYQQQLLPFVQDFDNGKRQDFIVGKANRDAYNFLNIWPKGFSNIQIAFIHGYRNSGKTRIAQMWLDKLGGVQVQPNDIYNGCINNIDAQYVLVDNLITPFQDEDAIFEFLNLMIQYEKYCLLCFKSFLYKDIIMDDLHSRFLHFHEIFMDNIDYSILGAMVHTLFSAKGHYVNDAVINYLVPRISMSQDEIQKIVDFIHKKALEHKKQITIAFIKKIKAI